MARSLVLAIVALALLPCGIRADDPEKNPADEAKASTDAVLEKLKENPDDETTLQTWVNLNLRRLISTMNSDPDGTEKQTQEYRTVLASLQPTKEEAKSVLTRANATLDAIEKQIAADRESAKKLAALVGTDSIPLEVETWVNGSPISDDELKGKVVLIDFWAVWCGPCIATFPHLREWNEKYAEKGLVIVGLTNYYKYQWDADAERASRGEGEVTPEQEQEMLVKFAEHHDLHHRFGIQSKDSKFSEHYGVNGIPHVVVIDRQGKVRLMRVGSGDENAKAVGEMIEKLIADEPAAGE